MALKAAVQNQNNQETPLLLDRINRMPMNEPQQAEWQLARAKYYQQSNQTDYALKGLNFQQWWQLNDLQWKNYHQLRHDLYASQSDCMGASQELIALTPYVSEDEKCKERAMLCAC